MQSVVITGASTGIGWATAKLLLDRGFRVFGSVRKSADADRLSSEFGANFTPLLFDVTDEAAVLAAAREVRAALGGEPPMLTSNPAWTPEEREAAGSILTPASLWESVNALAGQTVKQPSEVLSAAP
jgi:NAD(P)-dependent dehydrogenase (short-subunit alcohol dehydrogenase family)